jgi:hypothetical protein
MNDKLDIFEISPNGAIWRMAVQSHEEGLQMMEELSQSGNEVRMMNLSTNEIIATKPGS